MNIANKDSNTWMCLAEDPCMCAGLQLRIIGCTPLPCFWSACFSELGLSAQRLWNPNIFYIQLFTDNNLRLNRSVFSSCIDSTKMVSCPWRVRYTCDNSQQDHNVIIVIIADYRVLCWTSGTSLLGMSNFTVITRTQQSLSWHLQPWSLPLYQTDIICMN